MKSGFTLVELIMVIAILGIVALIAVPTINTIISDSKDKAYDEQISLIEKTAKNYMAMGDNSIYLPKSSESSYCVSILMMKKAGLLSKDIIKNPKNKKEMNGAVKVTPKFVTDNTDGSKKLIKYNYVYVDSATCN